MVKVRALLFLCLVVMLFAGTAVAQSWEDTIRYTRKPPDWDTYKKLREEADWLIKGFLDPVAVLNAEPTRFLAELQRPEYELPAVKALSANALRQELCAAIVQKAEYGQIFEAVLTIARTATADKYVAIAQVKLLRDCVNAYIKDYPDVAEPARDILLNDLQDTRDEVKYLATCALGIVKNAPGSRSVTDALLGQLAGKNQAFVEAAAMALGQLGDTAAVRPLIATLASIPDDQDPMLREEETSSPPVNEARLQIAVAVEKLTGNKWGFTDLSGVKKSGLADKYKELAAWWDANKDKYP